jgi:hypothetical protein
MTEPALLPDSGATTRGHLGVDTYFVGLSFCDFVVILRRL